MIWAGIGVIVACFSVTHVGVVTIVGPRCPLQEGVYSALFHCVMSMEQAGKLTPDGSGRINIAKVTGDDHPMSGLRV